MTGCSDDCFACLRTLLALPAVLALLALLALLDSLVLVALLASLSLLDLLVFLAFLACLLALLACLLPVGMLLARLLPLRPHWRLHGMPFGVYFSCLDWLWIPFWRPWRHPGNGLAPELAWGPQNGLDCYQAWAGALSYWGQGSMRRAKFGMIWDFWALLPSLPSNK